MKLYRVRGGSEKELEEKKYNIGIGISLGNKWFSIENIVALVKWALPYTREHLIIYVADSIHAINLQVRNNLNFETALKKADTLGKDTLEKVKARLQIQLAQGDLNRIFYFQWKDLERDSYQKKVAYVQKQYKENIEFRNSITSLVKVFLSKEKRTFSNRDILRLGGYIIEELPEIIGRIPIGGKKYDAYVYPFDGALPVFVEKIQQGKLFPEIKNAIMDTEPKVFLEVR